MDKFVAIYCRLSPRPDGSYEGVDAQERWGRTYAEKTWPGVPIEVFVDAGISAANGDHRPEFARFRQWVRDGKVVHVWAVEQTRLERTETGWFELAAELDAAGITEVHTNRDGIVRPADEVAGIKAVLAAAEVRKMRRRIKDTLADHAALGLPSGSRPTGFVHAINGKGERTYAHHPRWAAALQWAALRVLDGWSCANIAKHLREQGMVGPHRRTIRDAEGYALDEDGNRCEESKLPPATRPTNITGGTIKRALTAPAVAGKRVHNGVIVGEGNWEPILDEATWQAVCAKLLGPRTVQRGDGKGEYQINGKHFANRRGRKYLLGSGRAFCSICKAPMTATLKQLRNKSRGVWTKPYLICHPQKGGKGCLGIMYPETEAWVLDELWAELDKPDFLEALGADDYAARRDEIVKALDALDQQRRDLAREWSTPGALTMTEWREARDGLARQESQLRTQLRELPPPMIDVDVEHVREAWPDMTLDEQREFVGLFIDRVWIRRAKPGTMGFDSNRVKIDWRKLR